MKLRYRHIVLAAGLVALTGFALNAQSAQPFGNPLHVNIYADPEVGNDSVVQFEITNSSNQVIKIPPWQLPSGTLNSDLFEVFLNGQKVEYDGVMVKRGSTPEADYVTLRAGETKFINADLSSVYDMTTDGEYTIRFKSYLQGAKTENGQLLTNNNGRMALLQSPDLYTVVRSAPMTISSVELDMNQVQATAGGGGKVVNGVTYVGCSSPKPNQKTSSQIEIAGDAVVEARKYSENALNNLQTFQGQNPRYISWFRVVTYQQISAILLTVSTRMSNINEALQQSAGEITLDCSCRQGTVNDYAYVKYNLPYVINLCPKFWAAALTGTDSKAGTLVHEMSHFDITGALPYFGGTVDVIGYSYKQSLARQLAIEDPSRARSNASNIEYFAENTPYEE